MGFIRVDLQTLTQPVQQWLSASRKSKNSVVAQSIRLNSSAVFSACWDPEEAGSDASEGMSLPARVRASKQGARASFFHVFYVGCYQKV